MVLESIADLFTNSIITAQGPTIDTAAGALAAATQIGALAEDITRLLIRDVSKVPNGQFVAEALAGTIDETVREFALADTSLTTSFLSGRTHTTAEAMIWATITHDVELVSSRAVAAQVATLISSGSYQADSMVGELTVQETAVTND
jgi:hypothetical protein